MVNDFYYSSTPSIDLFLARNPDYLQLGKQAIIMSILSFEHKSAFRERIKEKGKDWYSFIFQRMTETNITKNDYKIADQNEIVFITFNYDRSLEQFLYDSLKSSFSSIDHKSIIDEINKIRILHIYGVIEQLDWQADKNGVKYGEDFINVDCNKLSENLKIIFDERNALIIKQAQEEISLADGVFFLGFGYLRENIKRLELNEILKNKEHVYGTALGFQKREIIKQCAETLNNESLIHCISELDGLKDDCLNLLKKYL
jgi:hypothetical protein